MKKTWLFLKIYNSILFIPILMTAFAAVLFYLIDFAVIRNILIGELPLTDPIILSHLVLFVSLCVLFVALIFHWADYYKIAKVSRENVGIYVLIDINGPKEHDRAKDIVHDALLKIFISNVEKANFEIIFPTYMITHKQLKYYMDDKRGKHILKDKNIGVLMKISSDNFFDYGATTKIEYIINEQYIHHGEDDKVTFLKSKITNTSKYNVVDELTVLNEFLADGFRVVLLKLMLKLFYLDNSEELLDDIGNDRMNGVNLNVYLNDERFQLNYLQLMFDYYSYLEFQDNKYLVDMGSRLEVIKKLKSDNYVYDIYNIIYRILMKTPFDELIELIEHTKGKHDYKKEIIFLEGIVNLYYGKISTAYKILKKAALKGLTEKRIGYIEALIKALLIFENDVTHLNLALGIINDDVKCRMDIASGYYKSFLSANKYKIDESIETEIEKKVEVYSYRGSA